MSRSEKRLQEVRSTLEFLEKATGSDELRSKLESTKGHEEVIGLAAELGYQITRESLAEAMKIHVDQALEHGSIPSWVRYRVTVAVHD